MPEKLPEDLPEDLKARIAGFQEWCQKTPAKRRAEIQEIIDNALSNCRDSPISGLGKAIMTAAGRAARRVMGYGGLKTDQHGNLKKEDMPRYEMLYSELLYFYVHITLRLAHGQHFRDAEITKLQQRIVPPIIEGTVEGPMGHWPEDAKQKIKEEHYKNMDSAEFEYGSCSEIYPTGDPLSEGNSVYARLARNLERQLNLSHNPEVALQIILAVSEELRAQPFPKLLTAAHKLVKSR